MVAGLAKELREPVEVILRNLEERDRRDRMREWGALTHAPDAEEVDTTPMSLDDVVDMLAGRVRASAIIGR